MSETGLFLHYTSLFFSSVLFQISFNFFFQNTTYYFYFGYLHSSLADNAKQNTHTHTHMLVYISVEWDQPINTRLLSNPIVCNRNKWGIMGCHSHDDRDSRYPVSSIDLSVFYSCGSIQVMDNDLHTHARTHTLIQNNNLHINHSVDNDAFLFIAISSSITNDTHFCVCV